MEGGKNGNVENAKQFGKIDTAFKKSIIQIKDPHMQMARAIATGICREEKGVKSKEYENMRKGRKIQTEEAINLMDKVGLEYTAKCGIEECIEFEKATGYQITIINGDFMNEVIHPKIESGGSFIPPDNENECLYLYHNKGEYHLIATNRVAGFYAKDYFCHKCKKTYKKKDCHKCIYKCNMCCKSDCDVLKMHKSHLTFKLKCEDCERYFPTKMCFLNHKKENDKGISICDKVWKCHKCKKVMDKVLFPPETHICGDYKCPNCNKIVNKDHKCYMFPARIKAHSENYIFFDFEADISDLNHRVMYAISMYYNDPTPIAHSNIDEWCRWAFQKKHKNHTFIAHNGRGYDYKFVIKWIYENTDFKPNPIFAGGKIMYLSVPEIKVRFIDSLSFITKPLKAFPKIFGETELKKGYFPHWFNTKENWDYVGSMPNIKYFHHDEMMAKDRKDFIKWYEERIAENYVWEQQKEMKDYCISDVDILRKCCIKFRKLYIEIAEIDPFQYLTIASVCMAIFKHFYIDEQFPQMLKMFDNLWQGKTIQKIQKEGNLDMYNHSKKLLDEGIYNNVFSQKKIAIFRFEEVEWMRKSFFGGRTNAMKLIYNFSEEEEGKYKDFTSLYPATQYSAEYPQGHPIKITEITDMHYEKINNKEYFGFVECVVEAPNDLYHPVLPQKGEKLFFDLYEKEGVWTTNELYCALDNGYKIRHIEEIWHFEQTTTNLFKKYIRKFLKIKQEASGFPLWVEQEEGIKWEYPAHLKETAKEMNIEDRKELYILDYFKNQGIMMDKESIVSNPGMREIAKLCLNSLWGKFGQRTNMSKCEIVTNKEQFWKIARNPEVINLDWVEIGEGIHAKKQIRYEIKEEYLPTDFNTNIAIASFTTSCARLKLYNEFLKPLNRQVLYFDTDSVIYTYNKNNPEHIDIECGDYLGEPTDELDGKKMVGTFVSGGPKNYSYELNYEKNGKLVKEYKTKVKGFGLNFKVSENVNHESILQLISGNLEKSLNGEEGYWDKIKVEYNMLKRTAEHNIQNYCMSKDYGLVYDKREIIPMDSNGNYDTIPHGHKDCKNR